jgi:Zn-dependent peptidase ImmA (M78 family)
MVRRIKKIQEKVDRLLQDSLTRLPPVDVEKIARNQNIEIHIEDLKGISGLIYQDGNKVVIGVNKNDALTRQRFTIAHELGHYFLHTQNSLHIDKGMTIKLRDHISSEAVDVDEIEANAFAAELLMPAKMLQEDFRHYPKTFEYEQESLDGIIDDLAKKYKVSRQAITVRLSSLGYFQESF